MTLDPCKARPCCKTAYFTLEKQKKQQQQKLNSSPVPRCSLTKKQKKHKNVDVVGTVTSICDRDRWSSLMSLCKIFPLHIGIINQNGLEIKQLQW